MRVPLEWLAEYVDPGSDARELGERLTMTGTKMEAVHHHGVAALEHFVVGKVLEAERHPDADRLTVCRVDVGGEVRGIVCGAPNVAAGQTVAVAGPGSIMPDGTKLKKAKLRGVESMGMILAEDELAIGSAHAGIMVLDESLAAGTPLADVLPISTDVLELEITPNRPDCLGIYGVAREVHATTGAALKPPPWADDPGTGGDIEGVSVSVEVPSLCPRFTARVFEDVTIGESPAWLKARLMAAGQRPISNVVDITNYVMLLTGQPLHAFDLDRVAGQTLVVRAAHEGETIDTLDGQTRTLQAGEIVIDDADGPTSLAGVMGGARSEVGDDTTRVLMEVAAWHAPTIQRTSTRLGLRSEASSRFEKGLSVRQTVEAQAVAAQLMVELCGARIVPGTIDVGGPGEDPEPVKLRPARSDQLLGTTIPAERQAEILRALEFDVHEDGDALSVGVPHFRWNDVAREADLVEEVARIDGVDRLPATLPSRRGASGRLTRQQLARRRAEDALVGRGAHEVVGWSFTEPSVADRLRLPDDDPRRRFVAIENPMSEDHRVLRTTLLGSLLDVAAFNRARGAADLALFESGTIYLDRGGLSADGDPVADDAPALVRDNDGPSLAPPDPGEAEAHVSAPAGAPLPHEIHALGGLLAGRVAPESWRGTSDALWDFFAVKGLLGAVLDTLRVAWDVRPPGHPFLHPGRSARVFSGETELGWVGEVHPLVARAWDLEGSVAAFELDLGLVIDQAPAELHYRDVTSFPAVRQDLAVVVSEDVPAADVVAVTRAAGGKLLASAEVFDVYPLEGETSLAVHLEFRAPDRTLTDDDVRPVVDKIVAKLGDELGARLRA
jgi:phenylalanyl-tRNA synthetase beta chain